MTTNETQQIGSYSLIRELGRGGMGVVYEAIDSNTREKCALKILLRMTERQQLRFAREAQALSQLQHPNIVKYKDSGSAKNVHYLALQYIEGKTLSHFMTVPWPYERALALISKLAEVLHYAHDKGIIHRDLKPANIILDEHHQPIVMDFGLAKIVDAEKLTISGAIMGTPRYMSPEQALGKTREIDHRCDLYALGCILFELLTGEKLISKGSHEEILKHIVMLPPPLPSSKNPKIPPEVDQICKKALEKSREDRYQSAVDLKNDMEEILKKANSLDSSFFPEDEATFEDINSSTYKSQDISANSSQQTLVGRYQVLSELGRGGMGCVYKAIDPDLNRVVALKVLLAGEMASSTDIDRFMREAKATAKLKHPHIVTVYDIGQISDKQKYFTMDFVEGFSLKEYLRKKTPSTRHMIEIMIKVASALSYAHKQGIIHRDLKPANIMINLHNEPKIMDFGLAKVRGASKKLSASGAILGTLQYMPPEQAEGLNSRIDERSDIYSLGAILYEILTGRPPFVSNSSFHLLKQILSDEPIAPTKIKVRIPKDLEKISLKALEKARENRYQNIEEFADDLTRFLKGEPIQTQSSERLRKLWHKAKKKLLPTIILVGCVFILLKFATSPAQPKKIKKTTPLQISVQVVDKNGKIVIDNSKVLDKLTSPHVQLLVSWKRSKKISSPVEVMVFGEKIEFLRLQANSKRKNLYCPLKLKKMHGYFVATVQVTVAGTFKKQQISFFIEKPTKKLIEKAVIENAQPPVLYYSFDSGKIKDLSNNGHRGLLQNGAKITVGGISGKALVFDGVDDYVHVPHSPTLNFSNKDFTIAFWLKTSQKNFDHADQYASLILKADPSTNPSFHILMKQGKIMFATRGQVKGANVSSAKIVSDGVWHYIVAYRSKNILHLYIDAVSQGQKNATTVGSISNNAPLRLSRYNNRAHFKGLLDEVKIYNHALKPEKIKENYHRLKKQ